MAQTKCFHSSTTCFHLEFITTHITVWWINLKSLGKFVIHVYSVYKRNLENLKFFLAGQLWLNPKISKSQCFANVNSKLSCMCISCCCECSRDSRWFTVSHGPHASSLAPLWVVWCGLLKGLPRWRNTSLKASTDVFAPRNDAYHFNNLPHAADYKTYMHVFCFVSELLVGIALKLFITESYDLSRIHSGGNVPDVCFRLWNIWGCLLRVEPTSPKADVITFVCWDDDGVQVSNADNV